jgi:fatty acid desaturase
VLFHLLESALEGNEKEVSVIVETKNAANRLRRLAPLSKKPTTNLRMDHGVINRFRAWYDSEAVRFFFFREKNPVHRVAEGLSIAFLMALTMAGSLLGTFEFTLLGYNYGIFAALGFFALVAFGLSEVLHYLYDRP